MKDRTLLHALTRVNDEAVEAAILGRDLKRRRVYPWHVALFDAAEYIIDPQIQQGEQRLLLTRPSIKALGHSERSARTAQEMAVQLDILKVVEPGRFDPASHKNIATKYAINPDFIEKVVPGSFREVKAAIVQAQRGIGNTQGSFVYHILKVQLESAASGPVTPQDVIEAYSKSSGQAIYRVNNDLRWGR